MVTRHLKRYRAGFLIIRPSEWQNVHHDAVTDNRAAFVNGEPSTALYCREVNVGIRGDETKSPRAAAIDGGTTDEPYTQVGRPTIDDYMRKIGSLWVVNGGWGGTLRPPWSEWRNVITASNRGRLIGFQSDNLFLTC